MGVDGSELTDTSASHSCGAHTNARKVGGRQGGAEREHARRLRVAPDLSLPGHPEVLAIGDTAAVPAVAPAAIQEGAYVAKVVRARLRARPPRSPFDYTDTCTIATIGRTHAVAEVFGVKFAGLPAFLLYGLGHLYYLVG